MQLFSKAAVANLVESCSTLCTGHIGSGPFLHLIASALLNAAALTRLRVQLSTQLPVLVVERLVRRFPTSLRGCGKSTGSWYTHTRPTSPPSSRETPVQHSVAFARITQDTARARCESKGVHSPQLATLHSTPLGYCHYFLWGFVCVCKTKPCNHGLELRCLHCRAVHPHHHALLRLATPHTAPACARALPRVTTVLSLFIRECC